MHKIGVTGIAGMQLRTEQIGHDDAMELLKGLFVSETPITDLVLKMRPTNNPLTTAHVNVMCSSVQHQTNIETTSSNSERYSVKAVFQKSTDKFLFIQANHDFVDFIFILLAIPLAAGAHLLGSSTSFAGIGNLYRSVFNLDKDCHLMEKEAKDLLLKIPDIYLSSTLFCLWWNNQSCCVMMRVCNQLFLHRLVAFMLLIRNVPTNVTSMGRECILSLMI